MLNAVGPACTHIRTAQILTRNDRASSSAPRHRGDGRCGGGALLAPELPHLVPSLAHEALVLRDAQLLAVDDAGALGPRAVAVVGVLLHVHLGEARLLLVEHLLLRVGHGLPAGA